MTFGLQVWRADGVLVFDSTQAQGGVYLGTITCPAGVSGSTTFTGADINGRTLRYQICLAGGHDFAVSNDGSGNPVLTFTVRAGSGDRPSTLILWAS